MSIRETKKPPVGGCCVADGADQLSVVPGSLNTSKRMTDAVQDESFVTDLREAMKNSKGPGNFRNLFMYAPGGKKEGLNLIPVSEVAAKDDFGAIKNISRDDLLAALRIPPQLMGIVPQNAGGFGSIKDAAAIWAMNELEPIQAKLAQLNEWLGEEVKRDLELVDRQLKKHAEQKPS